MKSLFQAADDLYNAGLDAVRTVESLQGTLPVTRAVITNLKRHLANYERTRFARRELTVTFKCPTLPHLIEKRTLTNRCPTPRQTPKRQGELAAPKPRMKKRDGFPTEA